MLINYVDMKYDQIWSNDYLKKKHKHIKFCDIPKEVKMYKGEKVERDGRSWTAFYLLEVSRITIMLITLIY